MFPLPSHRSASARVLVIEDDLRAGQLLQQLLQEEGYDVRCAADGAEGLAQASTFDPHFVLLDLQLPVVHGIEVAQHLRVAENGAERVIIGTTGLAPRRPSIGFDHWVDKPIDAEQLCRLLRTEWLQRFAGG